jgi:hypothetical protein
VKISYLSCHGAIANNRPFSIDRESGGTGLEDQKSQAGEEDDLLLRRQPGGRGNAPDEC